MEKITELDKKMELILTAGQILNENGATNDKIIRVLNRIAMFMKIPTENISLHITKQIIFLEVFDGEKSVVSFRKCNKMAIDFEVISSITKISWQILKESVTLDGLKKIFGDINSKPKNYSHWQIIFAVGIACGGFCCLFGGNFIEIICTIISAMAGKFCQIKLLNHKVNEFLAIEIAAFTATTVAYFSHRDSIMPMIACSLFLIPGVPIINSIINMINNFFQNAMIELFRAFLIILAMTGGIIISAEIFFQIDDTNFLEFILFDTTPDTNIFILALAAAICSIGFAIPLNMPKKFLYIIGILGASTVFTRSFFNFSIGLSPEYSTFIAAFLVGYLSNIISEKLNLVSSILIVPPLLPMIPGVLSYRFLFACMEWKALTSEQFLAIFPSGIDVMQIILSIVLGANLPRWIANEFFEKKQEEKLKKFMQ
ncbi:MAG: threonine/serine exporter family protein [Selenomonadaceae bacterium]|nr:threonine/serine exporter family protein [Selenomonadaceae bacterium]MBR6012573.1 threonine/serine exporter family protein [Selenomonadaceae bacterium]